MPERALANPETEPSDRLTPDLIAALAALYLIWSSTYFAVRVAVREMGPFFLGGARYLVAGAIMIAIARARGLAFPRARGVAYGFLVGALFFVVGNGFVAAASRTIGSGIVAVACGTMPLWTGLCAPWFGSPRLTPRELFGLVVGFLGVIVLFGGAELRADPFSALLLVLAPIGWAIGSLIARKAPIGEGLMGAGMQSFLGGVAMLGVGVATGEQIPRAVSVGAMSAWLYLVVFGSLVGFVAYHHLLMHARPAIATSYAYVNPVLAVLLGHWAGGEAIGLPVVVSLALIVVAVVTILRPKRRAPSEAV